MRLAMWSGPRNLSTAVMYAFAQRHDFHVVDEPFYGPYLRITGLPHPMRQEILSSRPESADEVKEFLLGDVPQGKPHFYQKHMTQHMVPGIPRDWLGKVTNVFLIRHPARVVASFGAKYEHITLEDTGFIQQAEIFEEVCVLGQTPLVVDSHDIRANPAAAIEGLCNALGLPFDETMLTWPEGGNPADGVWAAHWYHAVHNSTGFAGPEGALPELTGKLAVLSQQALPFYERMKSRCLSSGL